MTSTPHIVVAGTRRAWSSEQKRAIRSPGQAFVFRGRQGHLIEGLWWDGQGLCPVAKRLEKGRFVWPATAAQLAMLLEGIDRRAPVRTDQPRIAG